MKKELEKYFGELSQRDKQIISFVINYINDSDGKYEILEYDGLGGYDTIDLAEKYKDLILIDNVI